MENVLGTLFSDIANAIREKNGATGTMKPAEFAEKISAIETGGDGSGGTGGGNVVFKQLYSFLPEAAATLTIEHNLGVVPDIIMLFPSRGGDSSNQMGLLWLGFSDAAVEAGIYNYTQVTISTNGYDYISVFQKNSSICDTEVVTGTNFISHATETSVQFNQMFNGSGLLLSGVYYGVCIGGLT